MSIQPNAVVLLGLRAWTSLLGITLILIGSWRFDRRWDESDSSDDIEKKVNSSSTTTKLQQQQQQTDTSPSWTNNVSNLVDEYVATAYRSLTNPDSKDLSQRVRGVLTGSSGPDLAIALAGWGLLILSSFVNVNSFGGFHGGSKALLTVFSLVVIALTQSVILPTAIQDQLVHRYTYVLAAALSGGYLALALLITIGNDATPFWLPLAGAVGIVGGILVFWFHRKRGDNFDRLSVPNPGAIVFHAGGPLVMAGWLMMWVALNLTNVIPGSAFFLPVYWTSRTAVAFEGAFAIISAYWLINHAHDEHFDDDSLNMGNHFTSVTDIRLAFVVSYSILGIAAFLPKFSHSIFFPLLIFLNILIAGFAAGIQQVLGLRAGDADKLHRWSRMSLILMTVLSVLVMLGRGWRAGFLVYMGTIIMSLGWGRLHHDRKRGAFWLQTDVTNPHFDVYSFGVLIFPLGVLLLAWGMSIH
jgi:hypothetical protein